jgi:hypothetical protein
VLHWAQSEHLAKDQAAGAECWTWDWWRRWRLCLAHRRTPSTAGLRTRIQHWLLKINAINSSTKPMLRIDPLVTTLLYPRSGFRPPSYIALHCTHAQARSGFRPWATWHPGIFTPIDKWLRTGEQQLWSFYVAIISSPWTTLMVDHFYLWLRHLRDCYIVELQLPPL